MSVIEAARGLVPALARITTSKSHDTWRANQTREHRYKTLDIEASRLATYKENLRQAGVDLNRKELPPVVAQVKDLSPEVKKEDGLEKKDPSATTIDILALKGAQLPLERLDQEGAASSALLEDVIAKAQEKGVENFTKLLSDKTSIEGLSENEHIRWMENNSWLKDSQPELFVDYKELSETEKEKDRVRVRTAIETIANALDNIDSVVKVGL